MSWMQYAGIPYEIGSTTIKGVHVKDIAHSLARVNRFTGHTHAALSVARHSVFVSKLLDFHPLAAMYGLAHDVHESVTNDISYPVKKYLKENCPEGKAALEDIADAADAALYEVMGIEWPMPLDIHDIVKTADNVATMTEKRDLMPDCPREWDMLKEKACHVIARATYSPENDAELFMLRYTELATHLNIKPKKWNTD